MSISHFKDTKNKRMVRLINKNYIQEVSKKRRLAYFGLPGQEALDIVNWKEYISFVHAVEWGKNERILLQIKLSELGFNKNMRIYPYELTELLQNESLIANFAKYEIINFDFEGVLVSSGKPSEFSKLDAINKMCDIQNQENKFSIGESFLFLISFYATRNYSPELNDAIDNLLILPTTFASLQNSSISKICEFLKTDKAIQAAKIATIFPIKFYSECKFFDADCKDIVYYTGTNNAPIIHFVFLLTKTSNKKLSLNSLINVGKIERIPLQEIKVIKNGQISIDNLGIPPFERYL